jgi:hypothetical protein
MAGVNHTFGILDSSDLGCSGVAQQLAAGHNGIYCSAADPARFPTDTWVHVAVTYDAHTSGGTLKLYKNGALVDTATNIGPITDDPFLNIGAWGWWTVFNGLIDQAKLYSYALTDSQIAQDMNSVP